jgi:hypothetical protein
MRLQPVLRVSGSFDLVKVYGFICSKDGGIHPLQTHVQASFFGELVVVKEVGTHIVLIIAHKLSVVDLFAGVT